MCFSAECIECMATSDNVVRAGLTPKFKDVNTLCNMLTYRAESAKEQLLMPQEVDRFTKAYIPPVPEFAVDLINIPLDDTTPVFTYELGRKESASIIIVIEGVANCSDIGKGNFDLNKT